MASPSQQIKVPRVKKWNFVPAAARTKSCKKTEPCRERDVRRFRIISMLASEWGLLTIPVRSTLRGGLLHRMARVNKNWYMSFLSGNLEVSKFQDGAMKRPVLTSFPVPGDARSRKLTGNLLPNLSEDVPAVASHPRPFKKKIHSPTMPSTKEYWMPDRLCRTCYECELPFNMFRRRHHCRLCGQVFCHTCSSYSIDGRSILLAGMVRVCKTCHGQIQNASNQNSSRDVLSHLPASDKLDEGATSRGDHDLVNFTMSSHLDDPSAVAKCKVPHCSRQSSFIPATYEALNGSMVDSMEANLRRRLLGTSSFVAPISVLSATSRNHESALDLLNFSRFLQASVTRKLEQMIHRLLPESANNNWGAIVLRLAQEACGTVNQSVRTGGDTMDIRPYVKVKVIAGGSHLECCYVDGIVFRKDVINKTIRKAACAPRILLLSGAIDSQRTHSRLASFGTLMEQEQKYTEIIVEKLISLRPDILCVRHSISRQAQEYLREHDVITIQNVKPKLMQRIARLTGATILSSTDHISSMSHSRHIALGTCQRFQITAFPSVSLNPDSLSEQEIISKDSGRPQLKYARGHGYVNYVYLTGSPRSLGCTLVLRGADRQELKIIKKVAEFSVFVAYHLRLESSFFKDCGVTINNEATRNSIQSANSDPCTEGTLLSSSLAVDLGDGIRGVRSSALDHQSLLVTCVCMSDHAQCACAEVKGFVYYASQDISLGRFLLESCFDLDMKFPHSDRKTVLDVTQLFYHNDGRVSISVVKMDQPLSAIILERESTDSSQKANDENSIFMWSYCKKCEQIVTPLMPMADDTWKISFGKFLEVRFYNASAHCRTGACRHCMQTEHVFCYGSQNLVARFDYEDVQPYDIYVRQQLPLDNQFHYQELVLQCRILKQLSQHLFQTFCDKHAKLESIIDAILLSLSSSDESATLSLVSTVLNELNQTSTEMQCYFSWLQHQLIDKLHWHGRNAHFERSGRLCFPAQLRRELYIRTSNWNQRYSLLGQLLSIVQDQTGSFSIGIDASSSDVVAAELLHLRKFTEPAFVSSSAIEEDVDESDEFPESTEHREALASLGGSVDETAKSHCTDLARIDKGVDHLSPPTYSQEVAFGASDESRANAVKHEYSHDATPTMPVTLRGYRISSAVGRFLGKENADKDPWTVALGDLEMGRPLLNIDDSGGVLLVHEEQPTTIIAYSLSSAEYKRTMATYLDAGPRQEAVHYLEPTAKSQVKLPTNSAEVPCSENWRSWGQGLGTLRDKGTMAVHTHNSASSNPALDTFEGIGTFLRKTPMILNINDVGAKLPHKVEALIGTFDEAVLARTRKDTKAPLKKCLWANLPDLETQILSSHKTHIKHRFADMDEKGNTLCKFVCQAYWATQFAAVRQCFCGTSGEQELGYLRSLSMARPWNAQGGKSGATFLKSTDGRFVVKQITRTELQMFLEYAPAYFEYLSKAFFHCYATLLVKVLGVYQIGSHNRVNGKRMMEQVVVMQNLFHECLIHRVFDLKGSTRSRYARVTAAAGDSKAARHSMHSSKDAKRQKMTEVQPVLLDENFVEFTEGRPLPLHDRAKAYFNKAVLNDTLFLSLINVVDYSILVGMDEENHQLVVGIIDYLRQYDIIKKVERVGKSVGMIAGQAEPTVIQPPNYRNRFQVAMEKYFMMVPDKWSSFRFEH